MTKSIKLFFALLFILSSNVIGQRYNDLKELKKIKVQVMEEEILKSVQMINLAVNTVVENYYDTTLTRYSSLLNQVLVGVYQSANMPMPSKVIIKPNWATAKAFGLFSLLFDRVARKAQIRPYKLALRAIDFALASLHDSHTYPISLSYITGVDLCDSCHTPAVKSTCLNYNGLNYLYCRIESFKDSVLFKQEILPSLNTLDLFDAIIFDCRDNRGGYPGLVEKICQRFLSHKSPLWTLWQNGQTDTVVVNDSQVTTLPVAILVNHGSASATEILASIFQTYYPRSIIVGQKTSGAVNISQAYMISADQAVVVTIQQLRVAGQLLEGVGVAPDIDVISTAEDSAKGFDRVLFTARKALYQMIRQEKLPKGPAE